jgi:hypothetical protein
LNRFWNFKVKIENFCAEQRLLLCFLDYERLRVFLSFQFFA